MKTSLLAIVTLCLLSTSLNAQECSEGMSMINSMFEKMSLEQALADPDALVADFNNLKSSVTSLSLNSLKRGAPRLLPMNGKTKKGAIRKKNKRTFVTSIVPRDTLEITLVNVKQLSGVDVIICGHDRQAKSVAIEQYSFPEEISETHKTFTIEGMKGKIISVAIKNRESKDKFEFQISAQ